MLVWVKEMAKQKLETNHVELLDADISKEMDRIILETKVFLVTYSFFFGFF